MSSVTQAFLDELYRRSSDPWSFRTSDYERRKYAATLAALDREHYSTILEIGCGNGELARSLHQRCELYVGVDAVAIALDEARRAVPSGRFSQVYLPDELPACDPELIVLSEILYFLDRECLSMLAAQLNHRWAMAELLFVNMLGDTGNALSGEDALQHFINELKSDYPLVEVARTGDYRIDRLPRAAAGVRL
ncbi:SAM-dependent methyltransferase [Granulosicoccus sp. 3-233]|uniref:SAM-dependent methyltransferase n=1 Tax=Granulosicoccus sp. 3-233 TaxID=3417969 RepID=UPI003D336796